MIVAPMLRRPVTFRPAPPRERRERWDCRYEVGSFHPLDQHVEAQEHDREPAEWPSEREQGRPLEDGREPEVMLQVDDVNHHERDQRRGAERDERAQGRTPLHRHDNCDRNRAGPRRDHERGRESREEGQDDTITRPDPERPARRGVPFDAHVGIAGNIRRRAPSSA